MGWSPGPRPLPNEGDDANPGPGEGLQENRAPRNHERAYGTAQELSSLISLL
jgi:hypothetical protein